MQLRNALFALALGLAACGPQTAADGVSESDSSLETAAGHGQPDAPMLGLHWAKDQAKSSGGSGSPDLTWHSGAILNSSHVVAIYWGTSWSSSTFVGDKVSGLDSFYTGLGGTKYMGTNTEYTGTNGQVGSGVTYAGHVFDLSAGPTHAPRTSAINSEVCKALAANGITPVANGYYPVYTDLPRGHAGYCAWHSYGTCNGVDVQFGFFFNLDGDPGCDPKDTWTTHSQGLAALANVSGHELSETVTDPRNGGWWDSSGSENADKCAWTFNKPVTLGGSTWKVQGNWSNAAYDNGQIGYANGGCIDGN